MCGVVCVCVCVCNGLKMLREMTFENTHQRVIRMEMFEMGVIGGNQSPKRERENVTKEHFTP